MGAPGHRPARSSTFGIPSSSLSSRARSSICGERSTPSALPARRGPGGLPRGQSGAAADVEHSIISTDTCSFPQPHVVASQLSVVVEHFQPPASPRRYSRTPTESDAAVGHGLVVVAGVVDPVVVLGAERDRVGEVGAAALGPGLSVVQFAPGVGAFAAGGGAGGVFESFGHSLGLGEQPALPAEVEGDGLGAEDGGEDAGVAGEAAGFSGGEGLVGVEVGCLQSAGQDGVVDGDDNRGSTLGVQVVGGEVLEELGERESAAVPPVEGPVGAAGPARASVGVRSSRR